MVTVEAASALLQTDKADTHTEFATTAVTNLPIGAYRNYQTMLILVPGATPTAFQNAQVDSPGRSLTTNINGTNRNSNNTRVDGAANVYIWLPHHTLYNPPIESVDAVNVATTSFDADQGMTGGAAVTVTTKSGTNDIHGVAFRYHDDNALKARPYFWYNKKPLSINNIIGGTLGGPIIKNKLFYFGSYERTSQRTGNTARYSVPTADIRTGDFSKYAAFSTIYDAIKHELNHWQPETANPRGAITFGGNATMIKGGTSRSINQYAAALLGLATVYNKSISPPPAPSSPPPHRKIAHRASGNLERSRD